MPEIQVQLFKSGCVFYTYVFRFCLQNFGDPKFSEQNTKQIPFPSCPVWGLLKLQLWTLESSLGNLGTVLDHFEDMLPSLKIIRISSHFTQPESINACMTLTLTIPHNWMDRSSSCASYVPSQTMLRSPARRKNFRCFTQNQPRLEKFLKKTTTKDERLSKISGPQRNTENEWLSIE